VTALVLVSSLLLAAEGPFLRCFDAETGVLLSTTRIFPDQTIHGLAAREIGFRRTDSENTNDGNPFEVLVWGGCCVRPLGIALKRAGGPSCRSAPPQIELGPTISRLPDWILGLSVGDQQQPYGRFERAAAITAHNALFLLEPDTRQVNSLTTVSAASR
jgi:WD repeat-containing protein 6